MSRVLLLAVNRSQQSYFSKISEFDPSIKAMHVSSLPLIFFPKILSKKEWELCRRVVQLRLVTIDQESVGFRMKPLRRRLHAIKFFLSTYFFMQRTKTYFSSSFHPVIGLWNGRKWRQLIVSELFLIGGVKSLFFENGALPDTTTVDFKGVNYASSIPRDPRFYLDRETKKAELPTKLTERKNKFKTTEKDRKGLPDSFVFVPFQVDSDTQIVEYSHWIRNMEHLYEVVVNLKNSLGDKIPAIVIKEHPSSKNTYRHLHGLNNDVQFYNSYNTQELIEKSEFIITVNSSVGLEALLLDKSVIMLGESFYKLEGLVSSADNLEELSAACLNLKPSDGILRIAFLDYLYNDYYLKGSWREPSQEHISSVVKLIQEYREGNVGEKLGRA